MTFHFVAFGSNLPGSAGTPAETIESAIKSMSENGISIVRVARFYRSDAVPAGSGPPFINTCASVKSELPLGKLLRVLHGVEKFHGRTRHNRWAARNLDLDLIASGDTVLPDSRTQTHWRRLPPEAQARSAPDELVLPHPRMQDRAFVLEPLAEIAPAWRHPLTGLTVMQMLAALPQADRDAVQPLG